MKRILSVGISILLSFCLLAASVPLSVSAFLEENQDPDAKATRLLEPVNPKATQEAKNLLAYLGSLTDTDQFVVGQFDIGNTNQVWNNVMDQYGVAPALYSNRYVLNVTDNPRASKIEVMSLLETNGLLAEHYAQGHILLVHMDGPWDYMIEKGVDGDKYDAESGSAYGLVAEFDATNPDRDLSVYAAWLEYINVYIRSLQELENRGVKAYMTRPFVEANMISIFGNDAAYYDTFIRVYRQFVQHFLDSSLTGYLMTYSPGGRAKATGTYPGNEWLDVLGVTCYTGTGWDGYCNVGGFPQYDWFCETGKPFGLTEVSCRGDHEDAPKASWYNMLKSIRDQWSGISYACCWGDGAWSLQLHDHKGILLSGQDDGKSFLCSPFSINADNVADYQNGKWTMSGLARIYTEAEMSGDFIGLEEKLYTHAELKAMGFGGKVGSLDVTRGYTATFYTEDNGEGDYWGYGNDLRDASSIGGGKAIRSIRIARQERVSDRKGIQVYASDISENAWKVRDGLTARWTCNSRKGNAYHVTYEMPEAVTVNRYILRHAGYADEARERNVADYQFQFSMDGAHWVTADTVTGNTFNKNDRMISPVTAQYFRLNITKPNADPATLGAYLSICEWELYGVDGGKSGTRIIAPITNLGGQVRDTESADRYALRFGFSADMEGVTYADADPLASGNYARAIAADAAITVNGEKRLITDFGVLITTKETSTITYNDVNNTTAKKISAQNLYDVSGNTITFTAVVTDIPAVHKSTLLYACPYVELADGGVLYGTVISRSIYTATDAVE